MNMHRHLASSTKLYLNRRLVGVFSSNKRSGTSERASTLFPGFAVFKNSTRLHFSWEVTCCQPRNMESLGSQRWVFSCVAYSLLNPISLETLQSMHTGWSFILWTCDNLLFVTLWQNPLSQQNKDSRSVLSHRLRMREIPAPPRPLTTQINSWFQGKPIVTLKCWNVYNGKQYWSIKT